MWDNQALKEVEWNIATFSLKPDGTHCVFMARQWQMRQPGFKVTSVCDNPRPAWLRQMRARQSRTA